MAGGMASIVAAGDLGRETSVAIRKGDVEADGMTGIKSHMSPKNSTAEIGSLDPDTMELCKEILQERQKANRLLSSYQRTCNSAGGLGNESKLPRRPEDERSPLVKMAYNYLPVLTWGRVLTCRSVSNDLIAGLTVGVMVIPQSMSYAAIAGLEYIYGMYSAFVPTIVYAMFGQSRQLAVGPVAMVSLLVQSGLEGTLTKEECPAFFQQDGVDEADLVSQADLCPQEYASVAFLCAALVGLFQLVGSALNFGALVNLLGHPVTSGFTSGAAIIIGLSQAKYFLGYDVPKSEFAYKMVYNLAIKIGDTNVMTLVLGLIWFFYLFFNKMFARKFPKFSVLGALGPLISCAAGILLIWGVEALREDFHVKYIGEIPGGLPAISIQKWNLSKVGAILPTALTATLIGFMESIAIGKNLATKHKYNLEAGQEMFALGMANFLGACFSCYPVTGSFSRSAVANATGASSQLAGFVTGVVMLCTLLFLTPLFYYLPKFVLAAVVINSIIPLIAVEEAFKLYSMKKLDFLLWVVAFLGTLFLGVLWGIAVAVLLSLLIVIFESVRPQITVLWRIPGTSIYRSMKQESSGAFIPNMLIIRIGSSMYFANASYVKDTLIQYVADLSEVNPVEYIILEMTAVVSIDSTAVHIIEDTYHDFRQRGMQLAFAMVGNRVDKTMKKARMKQHIGEDWFFPTVNDAVMHCLRHQHMNKRKDLPNLEGDRSLSDLDLADIEVLQGTEVGVSNDHDKDCTVIFISLSKDIPMIMSEITALFKKSSVTIKKAEVELLPEDGAKHTYYVQSARTSRQLVEYEIERIREELTRVLEGMSGGPPSADPTRSRARSMEESARMGELEKRLASQDEKLDRISELIGQSVAAQRRRAAPASWACFGPGSVIVAGP